MHPILRSLLPFFDGYIGEADVDQLCAELPTSLWFSIHPEVTDVQLLKDHFELLLRALLEAANAQQPRAFTGIVAIIDMMKNSDQNISTLYMADQVAQFGDVVLNVNTGYLYHFLKEVQDDYAPPVGIVREPEILNAYLPSAAINLMANLMAFCVMLPNLLDTDPREYPVNYAVRYLNLCTHLYLILNEWSGDEPLPAFKAPDMRKWA